MKIIFILMFFSLKLYSQINTDMIEVRLLYIKSASDYKSCLKLDSITKQFSKEKFPILYSYNISSSLLSCNHIKNPIKIKLPDAISQNLVGIRKYAAY